MRAKEKVIIIINGVTYEKIDKAGCLSQSIVLA